MQRGRTCDKGVLNMTQSATTAKIGEDDNTRRTMHSGGWTHTRRAVAFLSARPLTGCSNEQQNGCGCGCAELRVTFSYSQVRNRPIVRGEAPYNDVTLQAVSKQSMFDAGVVISDFLDLASQDSTVHIFSTRA